MNSMPEPTQDHDRINDNELRGIAQRVAELGYPIDLSADEDSLVAQINAALSAGGPDVPPESEWVPCPPCPSWCTGEHRGDDGQFRDCESEEMFVPQANDKVVCVNVASTFNRAAGTRTPVAVQVEDHDFTPQYARHLARLLVAAADLAES